MVDEFDRAAELEQLQRDIALRNQARKSANKPASLKHCVDCWYEIETERQALGGAVRCAECQGYYLQEQHLKGF
ncbi:MAG: hypothetical protein ACRBBW_20360 [Cellvibrionaceae bacterium]